MKRILIILTFTGLLSLATIAVHASGFVCKKVPMHCANGWQEPNDSEEFQDVYVQTLFVFE